MFFFFSKLAYAFIIPANWLIALLIVRFFVKSTVFKKRLTVCLIVLFMFFGNEVIYTKLVLDWQSKPVQLPANFASEAGIVLGGSGSFDKHGNGFLNASTDRLVEIAILYKTGKVKKIIISGGSAVEDQPKEAPFLYNKFVSLGISPLDIVTEDRSRTTFENALFTKKIVDSLHIKPPFVLVTSALHIPRAVKVFTKAGLPVIPFPCDYHVIDKKFATLDYILPSLSIISDWGMVMKEVVGLIGYKLFNKA